MPMLASADGDVSAAKAALNASAMAGFEAMAEGVAPDDDSPCRRGMTCQWTEQDTIAAHTQEPALTM